MFPTDGLDIDKDKLSEWINNTQYRLGSTMLSEYYESDPIAEESEDIGMNLG